MTEREHTLILYFTVFHNNKLMIIIMIIIISTKEPYWALNAYVGK
jgi:hypothetical protein